MGKIESLLINGERFEVEVLELERGKVRFEFDGRIYVVEREQRLPERDASGPRQSSRRAHAPKRSDTPGDICSPIPGVIVEIAVAQGDNVSPGQLLCKLEAMKMQNRISSQVHGVVETIYVTTGQEVSDGELLLHVNVDTASPKVLNGK